MWIKVNRLKLVKNVKAPWCRAAEKMDPELFSLESYVQGDVSLWWQVDKVQDIDDQVLRTVVVVCGEVLANSISLFFMSDVKEVA